MYFRQKNETEAECNTIFWPKPKPKINHTECITYVRNTTRSQAVARIADRTASQQRMCRQSEGLIIRKSDSNHGYSGRMPVRWPETPSKQRSTPRSLSGKIICAPARHSHTKPHTKFEISSSSSFGRYVRSYAKIVGVTWPRPRPLSGNVISAPARHSPYKDVYQIWSL